MTNGKKSIIFGAVLMGLAITLGAVGAHALKKSLEPKYLETFLTGVRYHTYHGIGLLILGVLESIYKKEFNLVRWLMIGGVLLFSFNCYFYALSQVKTFAMIVPLGGFAFIFSWFILAYQVFKADA